MLVEIPVRVSFLKHTLTCKNPGIVEGDYNTTKLVFTFDEDIDATKVLFKLSSPQKQILFLQYLDESNSVVLTSYDEAGNPCSLFGTAGLYPFELVWQTTDSKLTSAPGWLNASSRQVSVVDNTIHEYFPLFDKLMRGSQFIFFRFSAYPDGTDFTADWSEDQEYVGFATSGVDAIPQDKSEYTWCKLRGKQGEAPYVGENGNWWVGGKDLGISPKPWFESSHPLCSCATILTLDPRLGLPESVGYEKAEADTYYTVRCKKCGLPVYTVPGLEHHDEASSGISYTNGAFTVEEKGYKIPSAIIGSKKSPYTIRFSATLTGLDSATVSDLGNNGKGLNLFKYQGTYTSIFRQFPLITTAGRYSTNSLEIVSMDSRKTRICSMILGRRVDFALYVIPSHNVVDIYVDDKYVATLEGDDMVLPESPKWIFGQSNQPSIFSISNFSIVSIDSSRSHEGNWSYDVLKLVDDVYRRSDTYSKKETYHKNEIDSKLSSQKTGLESKITTLTSTMDGGLAGKAPAYTYGTENIEAGSASTEPEGTIHFVYET